MRIQKTTVPGASHFQPGDEVEIEVVPAGGAAQKQQCGCGQRGDRRAASESGRAFEFGNRGRSAVTA